jgi:hypothetical protein
MSQIELIPGLVFGTPLAPAPAQRTDEPIVYWLAYQKRSTSGRVGSETEDRRQNCAHHATWAISID